MGNAPTVRPASAQTGNPTANAGTSNATAATPTTSSPTSTRPTTTTATHSSSASTQPGTPVTNVASSQTKDSTTASTAGSSSSSSSSSGMMATLRSNPYFSAGAGLTALGVGLTLVRRGAMSGIELGTKHLTTSLEIPSKDRSYGWVLQWISQNAQRSQHLGVKTAFRQEGGTVATQFDYVPSPGIHWIKYRQWWIMVSRDREKNMVDLQSGEPWETVTLKTVGRSRKVWNELLNDAKIAAAKKEEGKTVIYTSMVGDWRPFGQPRRRRPLHSVILGDGLSEKIVSDVREFLSSSQWYIDRGIPYRRGYLLHGPPGCGKSSFITALAGELGYNICIINLNERGLTDDKFNHLLSTPPPRSFILLEDVDAAFVQRDKQGSHYGVTFSGLLNALDGVASTEERIVFMTTNHLNRLDPALVRPGRVDMRVEVGLATAEQIRLMFLRFYPEEVQLATEFVEKLKDVPISIADLQGFFMHHKTNAHAAATNVTLFIEELNRHRMLLEQSNAAAAAAANKSSPASSSSSSSPSSRNAAGDAAATAAQHAAEAQMAARWSEFVPWDAPR